ncbi:YbaB/EbfC family nucleoid-associated protein [Actinopolymorpha pittospori]|uniref:DNA-binding protein YbaB n=1 Tax=Actinopolymorpha pittospori TaxID=648752 RepID=A0A927RF27_9ACTN|nr:YbaB/EbfC family nucleoid-associated protein [Actinopolymorpha pittospori]MBE1612874.1 DNA-binding protein YbaB [Actinopolymorpha pittospori]
MSDPAHQQRQHPLPSQDNVGLTPTRAGSRAAEPTVDGVEKELTGYGESDDGLVRVWVLMDGSVKDLMIDPAAMGQSADSLGAQAEAALAQAYGDLDHQLGGRQARQDRQLQRIIALLSTARRTT